MNYEIKKLEKSEVQITFELTDEELKKYESEAILDMSSKIEIKGFRKGHIPEDILRQKIGETYIKEECKEKAIQKSYVEMIIKEKLNVISRPKLTVEQESPFKFTLTVAVFPEGELKDYKSIKVKIEDAKVDDKEIEEVLNNFKKRHIEWKETEEPAKVGDKVELDFEGFDKEGKAVPNTDSKNHPIILGEGMIVKSFDDQLQGLKTGDKRDLEVKFPEDYHKKSFQGITLTFKTEIKKVENPIMPELNEKLVKDISGKDQSVEDFKLELRVALADQKKKENREKAEDEYISKLMEQFTVDIPQVLYDEEVEHMMHEFEHRLENNQLTIKDYLAQNKMTEEELREKYAKEAEKRLKARLSLRKAIELEEIKVEEEEIKNEMDQILKYYPKEEHAKIEKDYKEGNLKATIANRLAIQKFFNKIFETNS